MSTKVMRSSSVAKKTSSWVRPGVREVLARLLRLVSALMRLDLPTLERPTKAISSPLIAGSEAVEPAADTKRHSGANSLRPAPISLVVKASAGIVLTFLSQVWPLTPGLLFFLNRPLTRRQTSLRLSHNSILAPWRRMMIDCWMTDRVLFHAQ